MSTKIYNGYILSVHDFRTLRLRFKALREPFEKVKEAHLIKTMSNRAVWELDRMAAGLKDEKKPSDVLYKIKEETWEEMIKSEKSPTRNFPYDTDSSVTVIPLKTKTLALFFHRLEGHLKIWDGLKWVKDYHYQNQTDQPDEISAEAWRIRRYDWDKALPGAGVPSHEGFNFELCDQQYPYGLRFKDIDYRTIAAVEKRARNLAVDQARYQLTKDKKDVAIHEILESTRSEEGKALVEDLFKTYLPKLKERYEMEASP